MGEIRQIGGRTESSLLDDVLASLRVNSSALYVFDFQGRWATNIDEVPVSISWTLIEGSAWVRTPSGEAIEFHQGDTFLFPRGTRGRDYVLGSAVGESPIPAPKFWDEISVEKFEPGRSCTQPMHSCWGKSGMHTRIISAAFAFEDRQLSPLISALPEMMIVRAEETEARFIDSVLNHMVCDDDERMGFSILATQAVQMLLVRLVRRYALNFGGESVGWLAGLGDSHVARALTAIHRDPGRNWTVAELGREAGMSRSLFAQHFLDRVGQTPINYLRAWRIHLARTALESGGERVATLAHDLGYQSEAAFRGAFRRLTGQAPSAFRRETSAR